MDEGSKSPSAEFERLRQPMPDPVYAGLTNYPSAQSIIDQQRQDVERTAIAEFKAKYGDKPYSCKWKQCSADPYRMVFTVVEIGVLGESEVNHG